MANRPTSIKTLNQKIRRLARKYGTESLEYQAYKADIDRNFTIHYTKDGILQINSLRQPSKYQTQIFTKLSKRKGVKQLESAAKQRLINEGVAKPSRSQIEQEVRQFTERQNQIDKTLELIYIEEKEGSLPDDIAHIYNKIHRKKGSGLTNTDIDYLNTTVRDWVNVKKEIGDISRELESLEKNTEYYRQEIWATMKGKRSYTYAKDTLLPALKKYLEKIKTPSEV